MESSLAILRASLALEGVKRSLDDALLAYGLEPADSPWRPLITMAAAVGHVWSGDANGAVSYLQEVIGMGDIDEGIRAYALSEIALARLGRGDRTGALQAVEAACDPRRRGEARQPLRRRAGQRGVRLGLPCRR